MDTDTKDALSSLLAAGLIREDTTLWVKDDEQCDAIVTVYSVAEALEMEPPGAVFVDEDDEQPGAFQKLLAEYVDECDDGEVAAEERAERRSDPGLVWDMTHEDNASFEEVPW